MYQKCCKKKLVLLLYFIVLMGVNCYAQKITITGKVKDSVRNYFLTGVSVVIGSQGTFSNGIGSFSIVVSKLTDTVSFSYVGYKTRKILVAELVNYNDLVISLSSQENELTNFVVYANVEALIIKAVKHIDANYIPGEFCLTGLSRQFQVTSDNPILYRFYENDAVSISQYSYLDKNKDVNVYLECNKLDFYKKESLRDSGIWVGGYHVIAKNDIVHNLEDFINPSKMHKFKYIYSGVKDLDGRTVFEINFYKKGKRRIEGTVFIDTASFAFTRFAYNEYNISRFGKKPIERYNVDVTYQTGVGRWYLYQVHTSTKYVSNRNDYWRSVDFITISVDKCKADYLKKQYLLDKNTQDIDMNRSPATELWRKYEELFVEFQNQGKMRSIEKLPL